MEFRQDILSMDRIMHQGAGKPEYTKCFCFFFSPWILFNPIFLVLELNESRNTLMKPLNAKSNGIVLSH